MRRVAVRGSSGSGKSCFAAARATALGLRHVELDAFSHQPGWQAAAPADFLAPVDEATRGDRWVVDGNYREVQDLVLARADTIVWLDLPRCLVMRRLLARTLGRGLLRRPLWNANRGQPTKKRTSSTMLKASSPTTTATKAVYAQR